MFPTNETTIYMHYAVCDKENNAELKSNVCGLHPHFLFFLVCTWCLRSILSSDLFDVTCEAAVRGFSNIYFIDVNSHFTYCGLRNDP